MSPARMDRIEAAIRIVLEFIEAYNRHDPAALMKCLGDDCILEAAEPGPDGSHLAGKEAVTQYWQDFFRISPKAHIEVEEITGLGRNCILRWRSEWADREGQPAHLRGVDLFKVTNGLIAERLTYVKGRTGA